MNNNKKEELVKLYSESYDLTAFVCHGVTARGAFTPDISTYNVIDGTRKQSKMNIHLHGWTHIELPWTIDFESVQIKDNLVKGAKVPGFNTDAGRKLLQKYYQTRFFDCVIIDVSYKVEFLSQFLENYGIEFGDMIEKRILSTNIKPTDFEELLQNLIIPIEEINTTLEKCMVDISLNNKIVLIYTGWEYWHPGSENIGSPLFECWHPYLIHPFLDENCITSLINDYKILGIGSDTYGFECPLYYVYPDNCLSYVDKLRKKSQNSGLFDNTIFPDYPPVHFHVLSNKKYMIENLSFPYELICNSTGENELISDLSPRIIPGFILIQPIKIAHPVYGSCPQDCVPAHVRFFNQD